MPRRIIAMPVVLALFLSTPGVFAHDHWISRQQYSDPEIAGFVLQRARLLPAR